MMGSKAFESPLISHARMRAMYRALVETRVLGDRHRAGRFAKGLEACWVANVIDLQKGDLTSEAGATALVEHCLRVGQREGARAANAGDVGKTLKAMAAEKGAGFAGTAAERMLCAVGQAMALQAQAEKRVVVAFCGQDEMTTAQWGRLLVAAAADLPLILVCLPGKGKAADLHRAARVAGTGVPVIPVDAGDVVGMYRVAQESIGRARAEGGLVVVECVEMGSEPVKLMRSQMVKKGICTETWAAGVEASFRGLVGKVGQVR